MRISEPPILIIGAGPAGLTAGVELVRAGQEVTLLESDPDYVGGLARTVRYGPYRVDIGGHRFITRNSRIMDWWRERLGKDFIEVERQSRIYYNKHFFDYPLRAQDALKKLGLFDATACVAACLWRRIHPLRPERSFRDWVINRFGDRLFHRFFESYTEKVWGLKCSEISADWAAERIRGLSLQNAILNSILGDRWRKTRSIKTLAERFHYPRLGCGMMWENARDEILEGRGAVHMDRCVAALHLGPSGVESVECMDEAGEHYDYPCRSVISSMPLRDLVRAIRPAPPGDVLRAAAQLAYRDFLTVVLVVDRPAAFTDQWIYIHDSSVRLGRVQNFKNWSSAMVPDPRVTVLGLEYFCFEGDSLWETDDDALVRLGTRELEQVGLVREGEVREGTVIRMPKAYPVYDHDYQEAVQVIRRWLSSIPNLWSAGRNAMHQYNNQDHSMLTALMAVRNLLGEDCRDPWLIDHEGEYSRRAVPKPLESARS